MKIKLIISLTLIVSLYYSCSQNNNITNDTQKEENPLDMSIIFLDTIQIRDLIQLLDNPFDSLPNIRQYRKEKISVEDEEEFLVEWDAMKYFDEENNIVLVAESSWKNRKYVSRITLCSEQIKYKDLYVGQRFGKIKHLIDEKIPIYPDGELFVSLKDNPEIAIQLNIAGVSSNSSLHYGINSLSEIPDNLKVETIVIMKRE
jgi:hypothetical protein